MEIALIFAGGESAPSDPMVDEIPQPDIVVAADGGYDHATRLGFEVDVVVGDLDSLKATALPDHVIVERHPVDKDATDLELALELVARESPGRVVIVGGSGGRLDHELGISAMICSERWDQIDDIDWLSERGWAYVVRRRRVIHGDVGSLVSLIPMGGDAVGITTVGLRWELSQETLAFGTTRGVSNLMGGPIADIQVTSGCLLAVVVSA